MLILSSYGETQPIKTNLTQEEQIKEYFEILQREFELKYGLEKGKIEVEIAKLESALRSRVTKGQVPTSGPELDKEIQKIINTANFLSDKLKQRQEIDIKALQNKMSNPISESELNRVLERGRRKKPREGSTAVAARPVRQVAKPSPRQASKPVRRAVRRR